MGDEQDRYSNWVEIDLDAIKNHIRYFLEHSNVPVMAIVKANAYGHGAVRVAQAALEAGATWCGIARVEEAVELRQAGLDCPLLLLGYTPEAQYEQMIAHRVSMTVWDLAQITDIAAAASRIQQEARVHINVDTGMSRLGVGPEEAIALVQEALRLPNVRIEGLFTHFACADESDPAPTDKQERLFHALVDELHSAGLNIPLIHAANSATSLTRPLSHFNCVRIGIAMYGLHPSAECSLPQAFQPALAWKSVLSQVKQLPAGRGISYGHEYITSKEERIGTVPVGYADGFRRAPGNRVLVGGCQVPVVGRVTMDQIMVQLDSVPDASEGDEVVLIGTQGKASITAEQVAVRWGTINYEVTSGIAHRVPRSYR
jgi:alanine racemase